MNVPRLAQLGPSRLACASVTGNKGASELLVPRALVWWGKEHSVIDSTKFYKGWEWGADWENG